MANHYYGIDIGGGLDPSGVSTGTSSTSKKVELVILDGVTGNNKMEILKAIEAIESAIIEGNAPA